MTEIWNGQAIQYKLLFSFEEELEKELEEIKLEKIKLEEIYTGKFLANKYSQIDAVPVIYIGLGKENELTIERVKRACAKGTSVLKAMGVTFFSLDADIFIKKFSQEIVGTIVQAAQLALYQPKTYNTKQKNKIFSLYIKTNIKENNFILNQIKEADILADATCFARDLVNEPANFLTPEIMAEKMTQKLNLPNVTTTVLDEEQTEKLGMQALLTVGKSAAHPSRLIVLRYEGDPDTKEKTALVGKGVTCDTGGYCLKPASSMGGIKGDMAGAAAVCGSIYALAANKIKTNVVAVIPSAENRISRESFIPGDVIGSMAGKTIEIVNTDAEGRLILADAITYAIQEEKATRILDIATLTGAVVAMFGFMTAGVLSDDDDFYNEFERASKQSTEQYWRLPMFPEYAPMIESNIADLKNGSNDGCGTITAGLFLREFAQGLPWIHIDIAGTAWVEPPRAEYQTKGATGAAVTTLYYLNKK